AMDAGQVLTVAGHDVVADAPVIGVATVTGRNVEHVVGTKADPMPVVVELRPVDLRDDPLAGRIALVRICLGDLELGDDVGVRPPQTTIELGPALRYRIGNVELAVLAVVRVEGEPEQTALIEEVVEDDDPRLHVKKRL